MVAIAGAPDRFLAPFRLRLLISAHGPAWIEWYLCTGLETLCAGLVRPLRTTTDEHLDRSHQNSANSSSRSRRVGYGTPGGLRGALQGLCAGHPVPLHGGCRRSWERKRLCRSHPPNSGEQHGCAPWQWEYSTTRTPAGSVPPCAGEVRIGRPLFIVLLWINVDRHVCDLIDFALDSLFHRHTDDVALRDAD